jgi:hypothetical protein
VFSIVQLHLMMQLQSHMRLHFLQSLRALHKAKPPQVCGLRGFAMKEMKFLNQRTQSEVDLCADREDAFFVGCARGQS